MHQSLDGLRRRRIYLFRHGDVSYVDAEGRPVPNARLVLLTEHGRAQARAMGELMRDVSIDLAVCSGLPRTRETAELVLGDRGLEIREELDLEEIKPGNPAEATDFDILRDVAYAQASATREDARLLAGERFEDAERRALTVLDRLLAEDGWNEMALFAHGGINGLLLGWALGAGRQAFATIEQDMCCLNVIDVDQHVDPETGTPRVVRTIVRLVNATAYDPAKRDQRRTAWEAIAAKFLGED
jgi:broad specificity phosphatase PhoE